MSIGRACRATPSRPPATTTRRLHILSGCTANIEASEIGFAVNDSFEMEAGHKDMDAALVKRKARLTMFCQFSDEDQKQMKPLHYDTVTEAAQAIGIADGVAEGGSEACSPPTAALRTSATAPPIADIAPPPGSGAARL